MARPGEKFAMGTGGEQVLWQTEYQRIVEEVRAAAGAPAGYVGVSVPRHDVLYKVRGRAKYAANLHLEGMLHGRFLRSPHPHGRIARVDVSRARTAPGVHGVLTARDIPEDRLLVGTLENDTPILARGRVRFVGEPIVAVAAESLAAADAALELVEVEYDPLPAVLTPEEALAPGAPRVDDTGNVIADLVLDKGDVEQAFRETDIVLERTFTNAPVEHCFLEAQAGLAFVDPDGVLTLLCCTQYPHYHHKQLARVTGLPMDKVRVIQTVIGGAFGGKIDVTIECAASLLALHTGRPVKMALTREEVFEATTKRHVMKIHHRLGATRDGRLTALDVRVLCDGGAYRSYSLIVAGRSVVHAGGPYVIPNVHVEFKTAFTNHVPAGAMRSFGVVKMGFAMESQLNELAARLGISPVEIRRINALREGRATITGQVVHDVGFEKTLETIEPIYRERQAGATAARAGGRRVGVGIACLGYGIGYSGIRNPSIARMVVNADGEVTAYCGTPDIGTGSDTALAQILADAVGIALGRISVVSGDSTATEDSGPTSASRTTYFSGNAVFLCGQDFKRQFQSALATRLHCPAAGVRLENDEVAAAGTRLSFDEACRLLKDEIGGISGYGKFDPDSRLDLKTFKGDPYPTYTYATHLAEVEVDEATGAVRVLRYWAAHDAGRIVNLLGAEGQVEGGIVMGLGMALWEKIVREGGHIQNPNYLNYLLPGARDIPDELHTVFVANADRTGPYGAKGLAEASIIPVPAAVAAAIADAVGARPDRMPMGPEYVRGLIDTGSRP